MGNARTNIDFLKNAARFPKVEVTPVSVPTVQVTKEEWNRVVRVLSTLDENKAEVQDIIGKNKFNKGAARSVVTASASSPTGYILTPSVGASVEFASSTSSDTHLVDDKPDENIMGAYFHRYFGWIYDAALFTSHKIPMSNAAMTSTFFNGGIEKSILAFDSEGQYLGFVVTDENDWAHATLLLSDFPNVAYVRVSNCGQSSDMDVLQVEQGTTATAYEEYTSSHSVPKSDLPADTLYSSSEEWQNAVWSIAGMEANKAPLSRVVGKNRFNKGAARSVVTESAGSSTGYILTPSTGAVVAFTNATSSDTQLEDDKPDENIMGAYFHRYFGWMYDATMFTSHKIPMTGTAVTGTFFNGGTEKMILAFDANGQYLGHVVTSSSDWAHITMLAANFSGVAYVRVSNCTQSADLSVLQVENGTSATAYEPFKDETVVAKSNLPSDVVYKGTIAASERNDGTVRVLQSGMIAIVAGHYDSDGHPVTGSGNSYISDYVGIFGGAVYEFEYVNECHFYDANHDEVFGETKQSGFAYLAPENAKYMSVCFNGVGAIPYTSVRVEDYAADKRSSDLNGLPASVPTIKQMEGASRHKATYIIGDSEASNFHHYVDGIRKSKIVSSFGGHTTDLISTNVGQGTGGIGSLSHIRGCNVIVVAGTNDQASGQDARLIAYHRELIHRLRAFGANEIFAISPFWDITKNPTEMRALPFVGMLKRLYGGHYIDAMQHILDCGLYYNPYHPAAFTQPQVGGSVTMQFEDVDAMTECGMIAVGDRFWVRYYDDKADLYQCTAYSTTNNTVTAKLVTNGSDVAPGDTGGKYTESVSTPAWTGTKTTLGWVLNEEDATRIGNGQIPACIYADRGVHFGKILARIIEDMLGVWYDVNG